MPAAYILNMLIHTRHSCLIWHSCLDHTSHKWRHASAHRIHFNYAHTFKTWLSSYDTRFLSIPHTCDVIRMAFHITVQVLTHVTSPFYHSYMASGSYEYSRSTLYHVCIIIFKMYAACTIMSIHMLGMLKTRASYEAAVSCVYKHI